MIRPVALGAAFALAAPAHSAEPSAADRQALEQIAERMDEAWTAANADANAELFSVDATARFGDDLLGTGREEIRAQFRSFFKDRPPGLKHITKIERIEHLVPDVAMWDAEVRVERRQATGQWTTLTRIRNMTIVTRQPEGWRIKAVRAFPIVQ